MTGRLYALTAFFLLAFALLGLRAWQLQVLEYERYATRSLGNYLKTEGIPAPRGRILDRKGRVIAQDRVVVDLVYMGGEVAFKERLLPLLGLKELPRVQGPTVLKAGVPEGLVPTLAELTAGQENLKLVERIERTYPNPISGPVLGYVLLANAEQVKRGYSPDEEVGQAGLEAALEPYLRGKRGVRAVEVNVRGERLKETVLEEPTPGQDVVLTLDLDLQKAAERALEEALSDINAGRRAKGLPPAGRVKGAIVALDPRTGEVLAMASAPSFNPALFAQRPVPKAVEALLRDKDLPLLNRAVQPYTPGSTFKLATSYALLEEGYVGPSTSYRCSPYLVYGGQVRRNWAGRDMGPMTVREAIAWSCNTWYYQAVAQDPLGVVDRLARRAGLLGLGEATGLEIAERTGLLPTRAWKEEALGEPWYPGETLSVAIGQGPVLATPAQIARMLATIAQSGRKPRLHLVKAIGGKEVAPKVERVPGRFWSVLQEGLRKTVTEGTARHVLGEFPVPTGGKTGTAETPGKRAGLEHAWYMGYGPTDPGSPYPPLVVVAFFENGGEGSRVALPAVRKVMAAYWKVE
ncbi:penicillin-binding transpeptidase domain-containing protein [Thermus oshimai]|jgi:penicillin-binding protein 2|uniref:Cell division protein FtsI/penicillin-binding protein 2 n=1 Tax=Thermus oshimai JL-2 TaxID=751945 RepID=K7QZF9_THEOS|nr:penicillin-binding transpeptidase domain-containing protein [Thermus oshimai]AFV76250.1 cell division protein FtsI/penicillin-binding protein 2 [Thermus oshimai JL-2]